MLTLPTATELEAEIVAVEEQSKQYLKHLRAALKLAKDRDRSPTEVIGGDNEPE